MNDIRFRCDRDTALVETTGGWIKGFQYRGLSIFKGIPYAQARRFHAPEPAAPWEGVLDCSSYGFVCPLLNTDKPQGELRVPHRYWPMDENCLNLNIWTPGTDDKARPVMVWLHGGGFEAGSAIEHRAYNGENMAIHGDVVVVSVNHRLNILGYFDLSDFGPEYRNSGNAGGDDIIAALRWVHDNIARFGGDPGNVVVFGQSGGGAKITTLLQSPAADGLFHKGIIMSGVIGMLADAKGSGSEMAERLMRELGVDSVQGIETADIHALFSAYNRIKPELMKEGKYVGCAPHPNESYLGNPAEVGFRGESAHIPLLVGNCFGELNGFRSPDYDKHSMSEAEQRAQIASVLGEADTNRLIALFRAAYPTRPIVDLLNLDFIFRGPEIPYIELRSRCPGSVWSYVFNMDQPIDGGLAPWHCADVPYVFRNVDMVPYTHGEGADAERVQDEVFRRVIAFARNGDPNDEGLTSWAPCRPGAENTLLLSEESYVQPNHDHVLLPAFAEVMGPVFQRMMEQIMGDMQH